MQNKIDKLTDSINDASKKMTNSAKNVAFDLIAVAIIVAMLVISLGAIEMKEITLKTTIDIIISVVPFYLANIVLSLNYYKKGVYFGKRSESFVAIVKLYSNIVNLLDGDHHRLLKDFCIEYNNEALKNLQKNLLERYSLTYEEFMFGNDKHRPFVQMENKEIKRLCGKEVCNVIKVVKKLSVKGINVNILLGSYSKSDITDLGFTETQLARKRLFLYVFWSLISIVAITLVTAKDIWEWGWIGAAIALFKLLWIVCIAYMRYYQGFDDITIKFANHISRKSDILKEFNSWYDEHEKLNNEDEQLKIGI